MNFSTVVDVCATIAWWGALALLTFGIAKLLFIPLAVFAEFYKGWLGDLAGVDQSRRWSFRDVRPLVSMIIPAYNEGVVLANCVQSVLRSSYPNIEVFIIDDGSTDNTREVGEALEKTDDRVTYVYQENAGKGAALNRGIELSSGSVLVFLDADSVFMASTVDELLRGFTDRTVGAVCGDDRPVNVDRPLTAMLAVLSHAGTGMVRRALHAMGVLPIVSGNIGAFPRRVVEEVGGFNTSTVGEDLELTWRVHRAGYSVAFAPRALVYAESPSTIGNLWRQRVRWSRGLLQTMRLHWRMIGNPRYGSFGVYLFINTLTMVVAPVLQIIVLVLLPFAIARHPDVISRSAIGVVGWIGVVTALVVVLISMWLNNALRDIKHLWTIIFWPIYSTVTGAVMITAIWKEVSGAESRWNKMERTGVVTADSAKAAVGGETAPTRGERSTRRQASGITPTAVRIRSEQRVVTAVVMALNSVGALYLAYKILEWGIAAIW